MSLNIISSCGYCETVDQKKIIYRLNSISMFLNQSSYISINFTISLMVSTVKNAAEKKIIEQFMTFRFIGCHLLSIHQTRNSIQSDQRGISYKKECVWLRFALNTGLNQIIIIYYLRCASCLAI